MVVTIVAVVTLKSNFRWGDLIVKTDNRYKKNDVKIKGSGNKVSQDSSVIDFTSENKTDVDGNDNDLTQK
jgi:hypothetical protein